MVNIVLHGLGQKPASWEKVKSCVGDTELIIPDLFALVKSPIDYDILFRAFEEYCDGIKDDLNLGGLSMGGVIALDYASRHPDRVNSLILMAIPYKIPKDLIEKQNEMFKQMPDEAFTALGISKEDLISLVQTMSEVDIPDKVQAVDCKCLMVCGENDAANIEGVKTIHNIIHNSSLAIIKNSGHEINNDNPEDLARIMTDFWN